MAKKFNVGRQTEILPGRIDGVNDQRMLTEITGRGAGFDDPRLLTRSIDIGVGAGRSTQGYIDSRIIKPGAANTPLREDIAPPNSYTHETGNVCTAPEIDIGPVQLNTDFRPNLLDNYDVVTYHWKLFIVTNEASSSGRVFHLEDQIIIAETGVTDLSIDNVQIDSVMTPSIDSGTGTSTHVKFEILEPAGVGLIDKLFYESLALGIGNWNVMPFYLQLQFKGRDPETSNAETGSPGELSSLRWIWTLKISSMKANVTFAGTKYEVVAITYNELAQTNAYFTMKHTMVLENLSTIGDAMTKLEKHLNDDQIYRLIDNANIVDRYRIVVDPKIAAYQITPTNHNKDSVRNDSTKVWDGKNATFPYATAVDKIIDTLCSQTKEFQELIKNSATPGENGKPMTEEATQMKKMWRISTESRPLKYDPRQQNYSREFTVFIIQYDIGVLDQGVAQDAAGDKTIEAERKRLMTYMSKSILKKKYNYIFTGLNDQVLNFDIRINNAFAAATARMGGIYSNAAMSDKGPVNQQNATDEGAVTEKIQKALSYQHTKDPNSKDALKAREDAVKAIETAKLQPENRERFIKVMAVSKPESWANFQASGEEFVQGDPLKQHVMRSKSIATPILDKTSDKVMRFISDVNPTSVDAKQAYKDYAEGVKGKLRPVARIDTMQQRMVGAGIESSSNSGIQKLSSAFSVAMHSNLDTSFAKVNLIIKGDPFWLFPQPSIDDEANLFNSLKPDAVALDWIKRAHFQVKDAVNILGSDNFLILRFRTPKIYNVDHPEESAELQDVETLSGVFKVVTITNKFINGVFTQELNCIMDYNINLFNFWDQIENLSKEKDIIITPNDLVAKADLVNNYTESVRIKNENMAEAWREIRPKGPDLTSNIPTEVPNVIPGLPNLYF